MDYTNGVLLTESLQQRLRKRDELFKNLENSAQELIKDEQLKYVEMAIPEIQHMLRQFTTVVESINSGSMDHVGLQTLKDAYVKFLCARQLLDHHVQTVTGSSATLHLATLNSLQKIVENEQFYFKSIKDYIGKSVEFDSDIQSRFNSLLNGGSQIVQKSKLVDIDSSSSSNLNTLALKNLTSKSSTKSNSSLSGMKLGIMENRPRSVSPAPASNHTLDIYSTQGYVNVENLLELYHAFDKQVLLIDFRSEISFMSDHISFFSNIVNIDPFTIKPNYTVQDIIDHSLLLSSYDEQTNFMNISNFELVIVIDQSSVVSEFSHNLLEFIKILEFRNDNPKFKLRRKPVILNGGFDEWNFFMKNQARPSSVSANNFSHNNQINTPLINISFPSATSGFSTTTSTNNYIHTTIPLSRSPSPIRYQNPSSIYNSNRLQPTGVSVNSINSVNSRIISSPLYSSNSSISNSSSNMDLSSANSFSPDQYKRQNNKLVLQPTMRVGSVKHSAPVLSKNTNIDGVARPTSFEKSVLPVSGLYNLGNSCYMNSVLQCIVATKQLTNFLLQNDYSKYVAKNSKLGSHGRLTNEYNKLSKLMLENTIKKVSTNPGSFKKIVGLVNKSFNNFDQQDAAEFLHFFLDTIHEDLNWSANKMPLLISDKEEEDREKMTLRLASTIEWERYLKTDYSSIIEIFAGQYASRLICNSCKKTSTTYIPFNMLSTPIPNKKNLQLIDCINKFVSPEILTGDNAWKCPRCHESKSSTKQLSITRLPPVLILHLERFTYSHSTIAYIKNTSNVQIPDKLDMKPYWPSPANNLERQQLKKLPIRGQDENCLFQYELYAIVRHFGTLNGGHYIAEVRKNGEWFKFDDDKITKLGVMNSRIETDGSAYVLFYEKIA